MRARSTEAVERVILHLLSERVVFGTTDEVVWAAQTAELLADAGLVTDEALAQVAAVWRQVKDDRMKRLQARVRKKASRE